MKNYICLLFALFLWCALMPLIIFFPPETAAEAEKPDGHSSDAEAKSAVISGGDSMRVRVYDAESNAMAVFALEDYVARAVSASMPENAPCEALKARAVAARSLACRRAEESVHEGFDLCASPDHCQAFKIEDEPRGECLQAAEATRGEYLSFEGMAALTLSHLSSRGRTESYSTPEGESLSYLVSVKTADESGFNCYKTVYTFTAEEFAAAFSAYNADFKDSHYGWTGSVTFTDGKRVSVIEVGGLKFRGSTFASLLGINSLCFTVAATESGFTVSAYGRGTGLGMSLCSAILMAEEGESYREILEYFYPGTDLYCF